MRTEIAIGSRVSVEGRALYPAYDTEKTGTLLGELPGGLLLVDFGGDFRGHNGHGMLLMRGKASGASTCWYVQPDYVSALPTPIAPAAKAPQAKQQTDRILNHLLAGKSITQLEAFGVYRIFRLAARIHELKAKGHNIKTTMRTDETGKPFAEYALVSRRLR